MRTTTFNVRLTAALLLSLAVAAGCSEEDGSFTLSGHRYTGESLTQWALPRGLQEVSGLALDPAGRLFAHADEAAIIFELDYRDGRALKRFALGTPPLTGDFEGIAWVDNRLYLVTSEGDLLAAPEGADGEHVAYELHRTGLGRRCEIEGLDYDPDRRVLLMACKTAREKALKRQIAVLAWSVERRAPAPEHDVVVPWEQARGSSGPFHPSGLTRSPSDGHLILAAARQRALIELAADGSLVQPFPLPDPEAHPQLEGIVMTLAGELIVADEGQSRRGRLGVYRPIH